MLTRSQEPTLIFDPEIERTARRIRKETRVMAANPRRTLRDYFTPTANITTSIVNPAVQATNFELKPSLIQMVQNSTMFRGTPTEDPHTHLRIFLRVADSIICNGVTPDAIRVRLFPWSLADKASVWLDSQPAESITTWEQLKQKFLTKYFPPGKTTKIRAAIISFSQLEQETLHEAWEKFQDLLRSCPHHGFEKWQLLEYFCNGLSSQNRGIVNMACGGSLMNGEPAAVYDLIAEIAADNAQWETSDRHIKKSAGIYKVDDDTSLNIKVDALSKQVQSLMKVQAQSTPIVTSPSDITNNLWGGLTEEVNYLGQKKSELRPGMQDSLVRYMEKVGHPCMGVIANYIDRTDERLQSIEELIKSQVQPATSSE